MNDLFWLTIILLLVAAALRSELFFYLLYLVVGLQLAARLWVRRNARALAFLRRAQPTAFPGETVAVELEVHNRSLLPLPWLSLYESIPTGLRTPPDLRCVISLAAGERRVIRYTVAGQRRGFYRLGPLNLKLGDVLGFSEQPLEATATTTLTIFPRVLPLTTLGLPAALPFGVLPVSRSLFRDPARPAGVRDYQPGDGVRRIDWKSSARLDRLQVRRYQPAIALDTLIALAFGLDEYPRRFAYDAMERAVVAAASIAAFLIERRQPVGFCTTGIDPLTGAQPGVLRLATGRAHLVEILGLLGRIEPAREGDLVAFTHQASLALGWGGTLVLVVARCDSGMIERLLPLRRRGLNIALVMVEATPDDLAMAKSHGFGAFNVSREGALE